MVRQAIFALLALILPHVLAEGYPKLTPDTPFITGSAAGSPSDSGNDGYPAVSMDYDSRYRGPVATLMVLPDGHIADTAEVTAARATHLAALDKAKALWVGAGADQGGMGHGGSSAGGDSGYSYPQPGSNSVGSGSNSGQSYLPPKVGSGGTGSHGQGGSSTAAAGNMAYNGPLAMLMVLPDGHIADTAEVTAARAAHLVALDKAKALWVGAGADQGGMGHGGSSAGGDSGYSYPQPGSTSVGSGSNSGQSYLPPQVGSGGTGSHGQGGSSTAAAGNVVYNGPLAMLMVLPDGHIADTAEVTAARTEHLAALEKAKALWVGVGADQGGMGHGGSSAGGDSGYSYPQPGSNSVGSGSNSGQSYLPPQVGSGGTGSHGQGGSSTAAAGNMAYNGPLAMLMVLPDGHIADTAEVTAARTAHLAALEKAKARWAKTSAMNGQGSLGYGGSPGASAGGNQGYSYPQPGSNSLEGGYNNDQSYQPPYLGTGASGGQGQEGSSVSASGGMPYDGPLAMLMVLPTGYLADTPDIAALRAAHISALLKAQAAWKPQDGSQH